MTNPTIGVVIVAFNSAPLLDDCLAGLLRQGEVIRVVVVDNSSDIDSRKLVDRWSAQHPGVSYVDPETNLGFAAGCNRGAKEVYDAEVLFFVNPDASITRSLVELSGHLQATSAAVVAGRLVSDDHSLALNARPLATPAKELLKAFIGTRAYRRRMRDMAPRIVGQVDGALLGLGTSTFHALGGFDERFELYYEDVDICRRAAPLGGCVFVPQPWGAHVGGASSSTIGRRSFVVGRVSRVRYLRKFGSPLAASMQASCIAICEFAARSALRQPEGIGTRWSALKAQFAELRRPGTVKVLGE